ncbi:hypothetical protein EI42_02235 [Thermosporothrix hazakensis]|uniref:Uncharacterized protein n=1 Tax=Thermosporothrix hazakensis TaxID=644383 RepID=A0A326U7S8_THEHA|nr:hypothetical protein EI42_02235 [Thermosporothrix hazakensis]
MLVDAVTGTALAFWLRNEHFLLVSPLVQLALYGLLLLFSLALCRRRG